MGFLIISITAAIGLFALFILLLIINFISNHQSHLQENTGEKKVRQLLITYFKSPGYHLLNNITLPFEDGTTQIDHILVSTKGIFVIETKHYSGWIFASEKSSEWTQVLYKVKSKFSSPLRQNYRHVKVVQELLDFIPKDQIHSLVVFTGDAVFKTKIPDEVVHLSGLVDRVCSYETDVITQNRLQFVVGRLECTRYEISKQTDVEHKAYLNKKYNRA